MHQPKISDAYLIITEDSLSANFLLKSIKKKMSINVIAWVKARNREYVSYGQNQIIYR